MASVRTQLQVSKPRSEVLAAVLAHLGPTLERRSYSVKTQSADGVIFERQRTLGRGLISLLGAQKTLTVSLVDQDRGTLVTIVGRAPRRVARALRDLTL